MNGVKLERDLFSRLIPALPGTIRGVEIGVLEGETSAFLLSLTDRLRLTGIDPIVTDSMEWSLIGSVDRINANTAKFGDRWMFIRDYSHNVHERFDDGSLDFVFIDGSHHYEDVRRDYLLYLPKVKAGGLMFLHDSRMNRGGPPFHPGPSQLADEIIAGDDVLLVDEAFSLTVFKQP
jgi:predicted O-methyltransferase YrrM